MTSHAVDGMLRIPGPLTMRECHAHIVEHQRLGPHSHSAAAMVQLSQFHTAWVEHCNAQWEKQWLEQMAQKERRAAARLIALAESKPVALVTLRMTRGGRGYAKLHLATAADPSPIIETYRILYRLAGADGWSQYGIRLTPTDLPCSRVIILTPHNDYELALRAEARNGDEVISDIVPCSLQGVEKPAEKVVQPVYPPDPPRPTDEQLRAHFQDGKPLADKWHPVVRQAIWEWQKADQERRIAEHEAGQAARDAEVERQRREFEKHPERLAKVRAAPALFDVARTTRLSVLFRIRPHPKNVCTSFQVMKQNVDGGPWIASGRAWSRGDVPKLTWRRRGAFRWALRASNKYGHVITGPVKEPPWES